MRPKTGYTLNNSGIRFVITSVADSPSVIECMHAWMHALTITRRVYAFCVDGMPAYPCVTLLMVAERRSNGTWPYT